MVWKSASTQWWHETLRRPLGHDHVGDAEGTHGFRQSHPNPSSPRSGFPIPTRQIRPVSRWRNVVPEIGHQISSPSRLICSYVKTGPSAQT